MKYIDYACYDYSINEVDVESNIYQAIKIGAQSISIFPYSIPYVKNIQAVKDKKVSVSCVIDFPYGLSDIKTRNFAVTQVCKTGIDYVDIFMPTKIISNRKYEKFREDIRSNLEICNENNVKLRYMLEYRVYSHEVLAKICQILLSFGIDTILPSSGTMIDDINDNLIACNFLMAKSNIKTICTGNFYLDKHSKLISSINDLYGIRFFHISSLNSFLSNRSS